MAARKCSNCNGNDLAEVLIKELRWINLGFMNDLYINQYVCFDCGEVGAFIEDNDKLKELKEHCIKEDYMIKAE